MLRRSRAACAPCAVATAPPRRRWAQPPKRSATTLAAAYAPGDLAQQQQQQQQQQLQRQQPHQPGDVVVGRIIQTGRHGSRVELEGGTVGFLPHHRGPRHLDGDVYSHPRSKQRAAASPATPAAAATDAPRPGVGLVREFQVLRCGDGSGGPLLSAADCDTAVLFRRVQQVAELAAEGSVELTARVVSRNSAGLLAHCLGLLGFIPRSKLPRKMRDAYDAGEDELLVDVLVPAAVLEASPPRRLTLSVVDAVAAKCAALAPSDVVQGVVSTVRKAHCWVELHGMGLSTTSVAGDLSLADALLQCTNTSVEHQRIGHMKDVFTPGERVTAMVLRGAQAGRCMELSTAHLEVAAGDMLGDKGAVYRSAARQAALVRERMGELAARQEREAERGVAAAQPSAAAAIAQALSAAWRGPPEGPAGGGERGFALSGGYLPGRAMGAVMAAAVWDGGAPPGGGWAAGAGAATASVDLEQDWWAAGPLAWRAADEREQWAAERTAAAAAQQQQQQQQQLAAAGDALPDAAAGAPADGEQQWLQPPVLPWEHQAP